uniref:AlNc14C179G8188 protein n=1 Tax=Albugo laibachii Nc14 TaxID=890382 RepID=F0WEM0_9STRA|nr:AlNc14C75G5070 [Albugo laibachii Nc14]CCA23084.1 AlNc14C179G8188 [Albugo laibachii Nc14]|eukprot:CCA23084.1 AlNc14C179G8188 [Albugo laibachii Nc14]
MRGRALFPLAFRHNGYRQLRGASSLALPKDGLLTSKPYEKESSTRSKRLYTECECHDVVIVSKCRLEHFLLRKDQETSISEEGFALQQTFQQCDSYYASWSGSSSGLDSLFVPLNASLATSVN